MSYAQLVPSGIPCAAHNACKEPVSRGAQSRGDKFYIGVELDFWWNKFQIPDSSTFDTNQAAASLMFKYHF